jgi:ubiquinone/menaquinone biosynthesis C-methylase UbiE
VVSSAVARSSASRWLKRGCVSRMPAGRRLRYPPLASRRTLAGFKHGGALRRNARAQPPLLGGRQCRAVAFSAAVQSVSGGPLNHDQMEYEDYTATSQTYDNIRVPIGLDSLDRALATAAESAGLPSAQDLRVLDVGCGTGNYIDALKDRVGKCSGLEFNEGMLSQSQAKHAGDPRVALHHGSVLDMSCFSDESFNTVIMTQVMHHLTPDMHRRALSEMGRVLKPGGTVWIQTQTPHQHVQGFWWASLIPMASAVLAARFPSLPLLQRQLATADLAMTALDVPAAPLVRLDAYLNIEGPFSEVYRAADSTWALASDEELAAGLAWWRTEIEAGRAQTFLQEREKTREQVGQTTAVTATKLVGMAPDACSAAALPAVNVEPFT